LESAIEISNRI